MSFSDFDQHERRARREAKLRAALEQSERAARLNTGVRPLEPSEEALDKTRRAAEAREVAARLRARGGRENRRAAVEQDVIARVLMTEAQAIQDKARESDWLGKATAESVALAQARGEAVEYETFELQTVVTDEDGVPLRHKRGPSRDLPVIRYDRVTRAVMLERGHGLAQAFERGYLDGGPGSPKAAVLFDVGDKYRRAFEALDPLGISAGAEGGGGYGPKGPQVRHVEAGELLKILRAGLKAQAVTLLDRVCGEGVLISKVAARRSVERTVQRHLRHALALAADNLKRAKDAKALGKAAADIRKGNRLLAEVRR